MTPEERRDAAIYFLGQWFQHCSGGFVQFTYIRDGRVSTSSFELKRGFELAVDEAVRRNQNGDNVYIRVAPISRIPPMGDRGDESYVHSSPGMWAEVDVAEAGGHKQTGQIAGTWQAAENWIDALPIKPTMVVRSGGGFHLYWRAVEPRTFETGDWMEGKRDASQFEAMLQKRAAEFGFGLDTNITRNFACLLRLPGMVNWKRAAGHDVSIVRESSYEYDWSAFEETAEAILGDDNPESYLYAGGRQSLPEPGADRPPRGRNDTLKAMVAACLAQGKRIGDVVTEIVSFDLQAHDPPLFMDPTEPYARTQDPYINALGFVTSIMQSIQRQAEADGRKPDFGNAGQLKTLTTAASASTDDPLENVPITSFGTAYQDRSPYEPHLLEGLLPKSTTSVIAGPPKSQKSLMLLEMGTRLAMGETWFGFRPLRPLRVLLIQYEMSCDMMRRRIHGMGGADGYSSLQLDRLTRNFVYSGKFVSTFDRDSFPHYLNFARRAFPDPGAPPDVLVFDPLQNMYPGDENSNAEMFVFLRLLDELRDTLNPEAATVILHHANKTNRREMLEDPFNALRGASALRGYYTSAVFISRLSEESEERRVFFDMRAGISPSPKTVEYREGRFVELESSEVKAGKTQLDAWNAERRRQRDRILYEVNRRAAEEGELYAAKELAHALAAEDDLPGARRIRQLLSEYATRGYLRYTNGEGVGISVLDGRSNGYLITEVTEVVDPDTGVVCKPEPTHKKDHTNGYIVELESPGEPWTYDDEQFDLQLVDVRFGGEPFRGRKA